MIRVPTSTTTRMIEVLHTSTKTLLASPCTPGSTGPLTTSSLEILFLNRKHIKEDQKGPIVTRKRPQSIYNGPRRDCELFENENSQEG